MEIEEAEELPHDYGEALGIMMGELEDTDAFVAIGITLEDEDEETFGTDVRLAQHARQPEEIEVDDVNPIAVYKAIADTIEKVGEVLCQDNREKKQVLEQVGLAQDLGEFIDENSE